MSGFLDSFRKKVVQSVYKDKPDPPKIKDEDINDTIALGVLLYAVAKSDGIFLTTERDKIKEILNVYADVPDEKVLYVLTAIQQADKESIDIFRFTREINKDLDYEYKKSIIEILFRLACVDNELSDDEDHIIFKIARLLDVYRKDYRAFFEKYNKINKSEPEGMV